MAVAKSKSPSVKSPQATVQPLLTRSINPSQNYTQSYIRVFDNSSFRGWTKDTQGNLDPATHSLIPIHSHDPCIPINLQYLAHSSQDIASLVSTRAQSLSLDTLNSQQKKILAEYEANNTIASVPNIKRNDVQEHFIKTLNATMEFANLAFLNDSLLPRTSFSIRDFTGPVLGECLDRREYFYMTAATVNAHITIYIKPSDYSLTDLQAIDEVKKQLQGTLIHEMLHAMFALYACACLHTCRKSVMHFEGVTGHGRLFLDALWHIECAIERVFGLKLEMGRFSGFEHELSALAGVFASKYREIQQWSDRVVYVTGIDYKLLKRWGFLKPSEIAEKVETGRVEDDEKP